MIRGRRRELRVIPERIKRKRTERYSLVKSTAARARNISRKWSNGGARRRRDEFARTISAIGLARFDLDFARASCV